MKTGIFIFRRDFRLVDNLALIDLSRVCDQILPIFIFDPFQVDESALNKNYISHPAIQFMIESLDDLNAQLKKSKSKLLLYYGNPETVINDIITTSNATINAVGFNADFSPYSRERDAKIKIVCQKHNIECIVNEEDLLLHSVHDVLSKDETPVKVFGFYRKRAMQIKVKEIQILRNNIFVGGNAVSQFKGSKYLKRKADSFIKKKRKQQLGGRNIALEILRWIGKKQFREYNNRRDLLHYETTHLSPHLKFGTVSIREAYFAFKKSGNNATELVRQLYWRTWFFINAYFRKTIKNGSKGYGHLQGESRFKSLEWIGGKELQRRGKALWDDASTGFPVIDAAIRQLNQTGWMHNRARLLVANFAVKVLKINPFGEYWSGQESFSRQLLDCCYANNYGNWMWILGPYDTSGYRYGKKDTFGGRTFKTIAEFKKFDPELKYVRKWIPELSSVPDKDVWKWNKTFSEYRDVNYPKPIVDFNKEVDKWYRLTLKK